MSTLVAGNPSDWLSAGASLLDTSAGLHSAIDRAAGQIAAQLPGGWQGPAADAFTAAWAKQRSLLTELADVVADAGRAMNTYGNALAAAQQTAAKAHTIAADAGLVATGGSFTLPPHAATLPPQAQHALQTASTTAHTLVRAAHAEAEQAEAAFRTQAQGLISLFEDWGTSRFQADFAALAGRLEAALNDEARNGTLQLKAEKKSYDVLMHTLGMIASKRASDLGRALRLGSKAAARDLPQAGREARAVQSADKFLGIIGTVAGAGLDIYSVGQEHQAGASWATAVGDNIGGLTTDAAGVALTACVVGGVFAAPALLPAIAATVVITAVGVGMQAAWDHREQLGEAEANAWVDGTHAVSAAWHKIW